MRRLCASVAGVGLWTLAAPWPAYADNCSSLQDCYGSVQSAVGAAAGMALLVGLAVLYGPALIRSLAQGPPPPDVDPVPRADVSDADLGPVNVELVELAEKPVRYSEKILADMVTRGWHQRLVEDTAYRPERTVPTRDTRYRLDGGRNDEPASACVGSGGWYVVLNDRTHDVVQVAGGTLEVWAPAPPSGPAWQGSLPGRIAAAVGMPQVVFAGPEPCYPVTAAHRAVDYCQLYGVRILGLDGFEGEPGALRPRLDMVLDCSSGGNEKGSVDECAARARQVLQEWSAQPGLFVTVTVAPQESSTPSPAAAFEPQEPPWPGPPPTFGLWPVPPRRAAPSPDPPPGYARSDSGAAWSLVWGILGFVCCPLTSPVALFMGHSARVRIAASGGRLAGQGLAAAGFVLGLVGTVLWLLGGLFLLVLFVGTNLAGS